MKRILVTLLILSGICKPVHPAWASDGHSDNHVCFYRMDTDQDDQVTPAEFDRFYKTTKDLFKAIDQDEDGSITHEEYEIYWARHSEEKQ